MLQYHELELSVGDVLHLGQSVVTVIDIDNAEITFRIDDHESLDDDQAGGLGDFDPGPLPR